MANYDKYLKDITSKDESSALKAAQTLVDSGDFDFFEALINKTDYMFDFIKANVSKRLQKATNELNYKNILNFFKTYSVDYDEALALAIAKFASEDLSDEIFELLENGSTSEKSYAAKYFSIIPDTIAQESLQKYAFDEDESLAFNSAEALGKMDDTVSFEKALLLLKNEDSFDKLKAVKFFVAYGKNAPLEEIFIAMNSSNMPENIAGQIPYLISPLSLIQTKYKENAILCIGNIIDGLGEILPLSQIFQFEMFEVLEYLINENKKENENQSLISVILLKALEKFTTLIENDEYIFDEDKNTKQELKEILKLLKSCPENFWAKQKNHTINELKQNMQRILNALCVIKEYKIIEAANEIKGLLAQDNQIITCESVLTLKHLGKLNEIDKSNTLATIKDSNIKAIIESYWR